MLSDPLIDVDPGDEDDGEIRRREWILLSAVTRQSSGILQKMLARNEAMFGAAPHNDMIELHRRFGAKPPDRSVPHRWHGWEIGPDGRTYFREGKQRK